MFNSCSLQIYFQSIIKINDGDFAKLVTGLMDTLCAVTLTYIQQETLTYKTLPTMTELMISGLIPPASSAALEAISWRSMAVKLASEPPYVPNGVRFAATINTSFTAAMWNKNKSCTNISHLKHALITLSQ